MFYVDKYYPRDLKSVQFHKQEMELLKKMSEDNSVPHIIFHGSPGSGKKVLLGLFLEMLYDKNVHKVSDSLYKVSGSGNTTTDVMIKQSNYHIVIEPNNNNFDRYLIQDVVKNYARKVPLDVFNSKKTFKTVLINNVDKLSYYAQTSLRRTMEKYSETCRFIMWCGSLSRVIDPIKSRCYTFRISAPTDEDLLELLMKISHKERIKVTLQDYEQILVRSKGNTKTALWLLNCKSMDIPYGTSYSKKIKRITDLLLTCDPTAIMNIRFLIYDIMITTVPGTQIIKDMIERLYNDETICDNCKMNIVEVAAEFEHNLVRGRREINHMEAFIAKTITVLLKYNK